MPMHAQFPSWMMFVLIMMFMGPVMRMMFGGRGPWGKHDRTEIKRLEGALAERDAMLDDLQHRMSELESRLDFTERLLTERRDPAELPAK